MRELRYQIIAFNIHRAVEVAIKVNSGKGPSAGSEHGGGSGEEAGGGVGGGDCATTAGIASRI